MIHFTAGDLHEVREYVWRMTGVPAEFKVFVDVNCTMMEYAILDKIDAMAAFLHCEVDRLAERSNMLRKRKGGD